LPKFILLDHSLRDTGGHHFPYAISVLQAAAAAGYAPELAVHRDFAERDALPAQWPVHALFPDVSYTPLTLDTQSGRRDGAAWQRLLAPLMRLRERRGRERHARRFAQGCVQLFARLRCGDGDVVFLPTASELDLQGLARFVAANKGLPALLWHAQLHFGIHARRDWRRHGDTQAAARMSASLRQSLAVLAPLGLRLWCTTEPLAEQYGALGVAVFAALPYPVHPSFSRERTLRLAPQPARIACLGHARREKNQRLLPSLVEALWNDWFASGKAQLVVQNARPALRAELAGTVQRLIAPATRASSAAALDLGAGKLDQDRYAQLVAGSDIGLLLYDATRYHDRCSGVLLEMRVAGVPVIVPARSWLSDQIEAGNQAWMTSSAAALEAAGQLCSAQPDASGLAAVPASATALLLTRHWDADTLPGDGLATGLEQLAPSGEVLDRQAPWLEARAGLPSARCVVTLHQRCRAVRLDGAPGLQAQWIAGPAPPRGALGLAIASPEDAAAAIRDILQHIGHYKRLAAGQAADCAAQCSSARIVAQLLEGA
jgi:hypothetical protein